MTDRISVQTQGTDRFVTPAGVGENVETLNRDEGDGTYSKTNSSHMRVWSSSLLSWIRWDGTVLGGIGGGGGGAVTVADGADVAQGATTDLSSANTIVGILKAIKAAITGTLAVSAASLPLPAGASKDLTLTDGSQRVGGTVAVSAAALPLPAGAATETTLAAANTNLGADGATPPAITGTGVRGWLRAIYEKLAASIAVTGTFWQATQPVSVAAVVHVDDNAASLTVDAPVGTPVWVRLSDGAAAFVGQKAAGGGIPITLASDQTVVDNAAFADGTTPLVMGGYVFDEVAGTALTENDGAAARVDSKRSVVGVIEDATTRGTRATVKAGSTAPAAADTALVVVPRLTPSEGTAFASASKAVGTFTFDIADTTGYSGIAIITDLTVLGASSTVTNSIQVKDPVTGKFATATAAAFTAINTVSTTRQAMHPANGAAAGNLQGGVMTKAIRVNVVVAVAASTISVGYSLTP